MEKRIVVSGGGMLRTFAYPQWSPGKACVLEGAGALCAGENCLYVSGDGDSAIWRMDSALLVPTGVFAGGPGVSQMMLSRDGRRLYALCSDSDSLLMLSADSGAPLVVNRVGVNPCAMAMDEGGEVIAVAGGACGEVLLLSARSLSLIARLHAGGVVFSVLLAADTVYALSLSETMNSILTVFAPEGGHSELALGGMPGALALIGGRVAAATHQAICLLDPGTGRPFARFGAPGRAGRLMQTQHGLLMTDTWSDALYAAGGAARPWKLAAQGVRDIALL